MIGQLLYNLEIEAELANVEAKRIKLKCFITY